MSKCRKAHVTIRGKPKKIPTNCSTPCSPPSLVPCCFPETHLALKHQRIRKFALEMAVNQVSHGNYGNRESLTAQTATSSASQVLAMQERGFKPVYVVEEPQKSQLRSLFEWMCDMSPSKSDHVLRRSERLSNYQ